MNPFKTVESLIKAVTFPFTCLFVVGICALINVMTAPGHWWVQWVAFGMGIALLGVWARAFKTLVATAGAAGIAYLVYRWWKKRNAPTVEADRPAAARVVNPS